VSGDNRHAGQKLRARYARDFEVPIDSVELVEIEDEYGERCAVQAPPNPVWTTDGPAPEWMRQRVGG
jgi:hypothetical protein